VRVDAIATEIAGRIETKQSGGCQLLYRWPDPISLAIIYLKASVRKRAPV